MPLFNINGSNVSLDDNPFLLRHHKERAVEGDTETVDFSTIHDCSLPPLDTERQLQNIMDCILPPLVFKSDEDFWKQRTSTAPVTRMDMAALEEKFEQELTSRAAKPFGICPIRRQIYDQLFDELIRQTTVSCSERGLLLLRIRNEVRMTFLAYQTLLESSISYGLRKALSVENDQSRAVYERDEERARNSQLQLKIAELERRAAADKNAAEEELEILTQRMKEDNERLLEANKTLKNQLQTILQLDQLKPYDHETTKALK